MAAVNLELLIGMLLGDESNALTSIHLANESGNFATAETFDTDRIGAVVEYTGAFGGGLGSLPTIYERLGLSTSNYLVTHTYDPVVYIVVNTHTATFTLTFEGS